ncbi:MAG: GTPase HflX [Clostridia bacterium]
MEEKLKAIIVGINIDSSYHFEESMDELENLVSACDITCIGRVYQSLLNINKPFYMGKGKVDELEEKIKETKADIVVFNNELSSLQLKNLGEKLSASVWDRTLLILQIFAIRAKTKEAKLQVESARLKYMLPRLVGLHDTLGRQGGGSGLSNKGLGEKKIELDRRHIESKIVELDKELNELKVKRQTQRKKREESGMPLVALVGYTNAGKSTLMNTILEKYSDDEDKKVFEEDMLFATLETSIRNVTLENKKSFLLSDTVGFVSDLPHTLVKAFRSTLEEIKYADLLIQVIDYSDADFTNQIETTKATLKEIGSDQIPMLYVFNKSEKMLDYIPFIDGDEIYMSAKLGKGIDELIKMVSDKIYADYINTEMLIPFEKGSILSYLNENATISNTKYLENGTKIKINLKKSDYSKYEEYVVKNRNKK